MRSFSLLSLFNILSILSSFAHADNQTLSPNCSCYTIDSGNTTSYFRYHRFWDFRQLSPDYLSSDLWNADWSVQNWSTNASAEAPLERINLMENLGILTEDNSNSTALTLSTFRNNSYPDTQFTAEIQGTQQNIMHGSVRFHARVVGGNGTGKASKGACAGLFTWADDDNESDIEILTRDAPSTIRYTNQPDLDKHGNTIPQASVTSDNLPFWSDYHVHRIDWLDHVTHWFFDDNLVVSNTYSVPRKPSGLFMNMWGDGGEWSGEMDVGGEAMLMVEWVEAVFDTSGPATKRDKGGCEVVCKIDGVKEVGRPEVVENAPSHPSAGKALVPLGGIWYVLGAVGMMAVLFS